MLGWFGVMLLLAVELKMDCALPIGDQAVSDTHVPRYPTSKGAMQSEILSQRSTSAPNPSGSSSQDGWSFFPTRIVHDIPFMAAKPIGHRFEHDHDVIGTPDAPLPSISGYDAFDRDWLHELDTPKFTEDTNLIYPEPQELWISAQSPVDQTTTKSTHKFSALGLDGSGNTIGTPVASDSYAPTNPTKPHSPRRNFEAQHEAREYNDEEEFLHHVLAPKSRIKKSKKLRQEQYAAISHLQEALETNSPSDSRMAEDLAPGSSHHDSGKNLLAENTGHFEYRSEQSNKRKSALGKLKTKKQADKQVALLSLKMRALSHFTKRVDQAASELEDYAQVLRHQQSPPIALLTARTSCSCKKLKYILNPNAKNTENIDQESKYIGKYQRCFVPHRQFHTQTQSQAIYATKKMFSNLNYFMGRRYLWSEESSMGETIINLESKWLDHILGSTPRVGKQTYSSLFLTYECITISTTIVLYHIGLLYRLSNPLEEKTKLEIRQAMEKDLGDLDSLWMNFPFHGNVLLNQPQSNDFWSVEVIHDIKMARIHQGSTPAELKVPKILLCQWLLKKNHELSSHIKEENRAIPRFYQILEDFAWLDYFMMQKEISPKSPTTLKQKLNHLGNTWEF